MEKPLRRELSVTWLYLGQREGLLNQLARARKPPTPSKTAPASIPADKEN